VAKLGYNTIWGIVFVSFILSIAGIIYLKPAVTGYFFVNEEIRPFTKSTNWTFASPAEVVFIPEPGELASLSMSGLAIGNGSFKVFLKSSNNRYLVLDNLLLDRKGISGLTGFAVEKIPDASVAETNSTEKSISLKLEYKGGSIYDADNDGVESIDSAIDYSVENTEFGWDVNESNLCTRWQVYSIENGTSATLCYGAEKCCNFVDLQPSSEKWNDIFYIYYGKYGAGPGNSISAQVLYVDYSLEPENMHSDIYFSNWSALRAEFSEAAAIKRYFENLCSETCSLPFLNESYYTLSVEPENATLVIESISYSVRVISITNNAPVCSIPEQKIAENSNITLNLSEYCTDLDNDSLSYSVLADAPFYLDKDILTLTANSMQNKLISLFANDGVSLVSYSFNLTIIPYETTSLMQIAPSRWLKTINLARPGNVTASFAEAFNISIKADNVSIAGDKIRVDYRGANTTLRKYEITKQLEQIEEQLKRLNNEEVLNFNKTATLLLELDASGYEIEFSTNEAVEEEQHGEIELFRPVKWTRRVSGVDIEIPEEAFNVTLR